MQVGTHQTARRNTLLAAATLVLVLTPSLLISRAGAQEQPGSPIVEQMEAINDGYKLLRRNARRPERLLTPDNVELVAKMQQASLNAMHLLDFKVLNQITDEAKKREMVVTFKTIQGNVLKTLIDLEIALVKQDAEGAVALIDKLADLKKEGHDLFVPVE